MSINGLYITQNNVCLNIHKHLICQHEQIYTAIIGHMMTNSTMRSQSTWMTFIAPVRLSSQRFDITANIIQMNKMFVVLHNKTHLM